jgi:outer membrane protein TolC
MRRTAVLVFAIAATSAHAMTLEEAIRLAQANNRQIANARLEVGKANDRLVAMRTQRLPRVNADVFSSMSLNRLTFDFREGIFGTYPGIGPVPALDTRVTLARTLDNFAVLRVTQPITQLRQIAIGTRMAEEAAQIRMADARDQDLRVVSDVKRLFHSMQQTRAAMSAASSAIETLTEIEKTAQRHLDEKTILRADLLDVEARLASARATAATLSDAYATQREQMAMLIGAPFDEPGGSRTDNPVCPDRQDCLSYNDRPDVAKAKLAITLAEDDLRLQRAKSIPDVSLVGAYVAPSTAGVLPKHVAALTLVISAEPFTWGRRAAEVAEKRKAVEQARNVARDVEEASAIEIADAQRRVASSKVAIAAREAERDAAAEHLRVVRERFANEAALVKDVLERQAAAADAESRLIAANESYWIAVADLERASGGNS